MKSISMYEDIVQIKIPLPFPLAWVNSYLVRGGDGYTLIDPGLHTEKAVEAWEQALAELKVPLRQIRSIVLTHHHPDHYGLSGWFQERCEAPVFLSPEGISQVQALWGSDRRMTRDLTELFILHGMDAESAQAMVPHMESFVEQVAPQPAVTRLERNSLIQIGDRSCRILHTPGHALGHYCFYDEERLELFCGDHVLPKITPNVGLTPGFGENPLADFLSSLEEVQRLQVRIAYPGHRDPFNDFSERAAAIIRHHGERLDRMWSMLAEPMTAFEVCLGFFGRRLSIHQMRFAMAETLAHLVYLEREGRVERTIDKVPSRSEFPFPVEDRVSFRQRSPGRTKPKEAGENQIGLSPVNSFSGS